MEKEQNSFKDAAENGKREIADNKKIWLTPELRLMPVPVVTQTGARAKTVAENNAIYRLAS